MGITYHMFDEWINKICTTENFSEICGLNFNLYENDNNLWSVELVGTESFDKNDEDWVCDEIFNTRDNMLIWKDTNNWEKILSDAIEIIKTYLEKGNKAYLLKQCQGIGIGFVDGDIEILFEK